MISDQVCCSYRETERDGLTESCCRSTSIPSISPNSSLVSERERETDMKSKDDECKFSVLIKPRERDVHVINAGTELRNAKTTQIINSLIELHN